MKLLVDSCAGRRLARSLQAAGHDVVFAGDWEQDPGDDEILAFAQRGSRVIITRDKDFGTMAVRDRRAHSGIIRLVELPPGREIAICQHLLSRHEMDLRRRVVITAEPRRIRFRETDPESPSKPEPG
jgi:predicted nuclease of predicted toxin-antitoxin system